MVDSPQAVITAQVEAGVVVRMAVLYELLSGTRPAVEPPAGRPEGESSAGSRPDGASMGGVAAR